MAIRQVVHGGPQAASEIKTLQKLYQTLNELKMHAYVSALNLPLLIDHLLKVGELVPS
jgi:hypothetical protein